MLKNLLIVFLLVGGCTTTASQKSTWILPTVETHPKERTVATQHPVIPVLIEKLD